MLVLLHAESTEEQAAAVEAAITKLGFSPMRVPGRNRTAICITGNKTAVDPGHFQHLPGVVECVRVTKPFKLVSREIHPEDTIVEVSGIQIGGPKPVFIAGPCSVETEPLTLKVAAAVKEAGADLFRAGAYKPRTSPYDFQGFGREALQTLAKVRAETGLGIVTEVTETDAVELVAEVADIIQVGTRNMQNFALLKALATIDRPILLMRGMSASLEEWLMAAEYLVAGGNPNVILCERGIRTFSNHARNTLDLNIVRRAGQLSHLPILVDPSHGVGDRDRVRPLSRAALACGAQGLLVEAHTDPNESFTDAQQTIDMATLKGILTDATLLSKLEPI